MTTRKEAQQLAYYASVPGYGVLAPRGWYCFEVYGSSGGALFVNPQPIDMADVFSTVQSGFTGPAIEFADTSGGTSGRFAVAEVIARVFPDYRAFVTRVRELFDLPSSQFTFGPYPQDKLTYKSKTVVEFTTPAGAEGLGTHSRLKKNGSPIYGAAILTMEKPDPQTPDLLLLSVRLPPELTGLTPVIIRQLERDAARLP